ncbi:hypothetical protein Bra3105_05125 [Brachybacterium halotolerans subsp. kimchii]|uniref:hypothetical protein n=1 Tax=Brachybacterium halotolerans TaxID=2795215 RepID=UPI001E434EE1|nr:hypothetical protein [Brachybacterium halotolerans]UEJ83699.1 hypothetical protein Bra3105_05125 [Brachybacterium halotolerans subsp. kimchii]
MRAKIGVALLLLVTAAYCWGLLWIATGFARAGGVIGWGLAAGLVVLLVLTVWVTWREVLFGLRAGRLARLYGAARFEPRADDGTEGMAADGTGARAEQDPVAQRDARRAAARAEFEAARDAVQDGGEDDWRAWYRLGLAYSANRDTRDARAAVRRAIAVEAGRGV